MELGLTLMWISTISVGIGVVLYLLMKSTRNSENKPQHVLVGTKWVREGSDPFNRTVYVIEEVKEDWVRLEGHRNGYNYPTTMSIFHLKQLFKELV